MSCAYPSWLKRSFSPDGTARSVRIMTDELGLATVCESAKCPNLLECYSKRQLTFMILGDVCTRSCRFCAIARGRPKALDRNEPWRVAEAARRLRLDHVVITSVTRDDLQDEGAFQFVDVIRAVRAVNRAATLEVLVPDFSGRRDLIRHIVEEARVDVFGHNLETVERLSDSLRPQANYRRSLSVLEQAASCATGSLIKSGVMVGLGETQEELARTFRDLVGVGVTHLTIGQYLRPGAAELPVFEYISPNRFAELEDAAYDSGLKWVMAAPFVRSSYHAADALYYRQDTRRPDLPIIREPGWGFAKGPTRSTIRPSLDGKGPRDGAGWLAKRPEE